MQVLTFRSRTAQLCLAAIAFLALGPLAAQNTMSPVPPPPQEAIPTAPAATTPVVTTPVGQTPSPALQPLTATPKPDATEPGTVRPTASIREFRSSVSEVSARGATDMFVTALVRSRKFRVLERSRMLEGVAAEKQLNQQGLTTGQAGSTQFKASEYVFEATVSEASAEDNKSSVGIGLFGASAGKSSAAGSIAIDVRITDVDSGTIVDAVSVRKVLKSEETRVGGVSNAIGNALTRGRIGGLMQAAGATDEYVRARKDSLDRALREAIEEAVNEIASRLGKP